MLEIFHCMIVRWQSETLNHNTKEYKTSSGKRFNKNSHQFNKKEKNEMKT